MAIITIDNATFCHGAKVAENVVEKLGYRVLAEDPVFEVAARSGLSPDKLKRIVYGPPPLFASLTRDSIRAVAALRAAMVEAIGQDNLVYCGLLGHLLPKTLTHVLRICIAGTREYRLEQAEVEEGISVKTAEQRIKADDDARADWTDLLFGCGPWHKSIFDVFVAMQKSSVDEAVDLVCDYAGRPAVTATARTKQALNNAQLAARINITIADKGHDVDVTCDGGQITVLTQKYAIFQERQHKELTRLAMLVEGVSSVKIGQGHRYKEPGVSFNIDMDVPSKVLLVDDETEFVHTLSERLETRSIEPSIAYNGEEALAMVANDQPEVMVLDLKMPGIDGLEVLRRVKKTHPATEVIILTGHGSAIEENLAADLGAFAYLRKPVDIEELTETMKAAYRKVAKQKGAGGHNE